MGYVDSWNQDAVHEGEERECVVEKGDRTERREGNEKTWKRMSQFSVKDGAEWRRWGGIYICSLVLDHSQGIHQ